MENKIELRKRLKLQRSNSDITELNNKSEKLNKMLVELKEFQDAKVVFCYISFDKEINTFNILNYCLKYNKILCVPVIREDSIMIPCRITSLDGLVKNKFNILEPEIIDVIDKRQIDFTVVPALGFNSSGYRIGYGKGYYDIFLKTYIGFSAGMVLKEFLIEEFIPDKFDIPVNKLVIV